MKKTMRLLNTAFAVILAVCLCTFGIDMNVGATGPYTITITNSNTSVSMNGHTYNAYKVFDVTYSGTSYVYSKSGSCLGGATAYDSAYYDSGGVPAINDSNSAAFGRYLYDTFIKDKTPTVAGKTTGGTATTATISVGSAGYYLVVDTAGTGTGADPNVSLVMLGTTDPTAAVNLKSSSPSVDIKGIEQIVYDANGNITSQGIYSAVSDAQINELVNYRIIAKLPDTTGYTSYTYNITDTMDNAITIDASTCDISVVTTGEGGGATLTKDADYTFGIGDTGHSFVINLESGTILNKTKCPNNGTITVNYKARLNRSAKYAMTESQDSNVNENSVYIKYSNDPYSSTTTETTEKKAYLYTYGLQIEKVDSIDKNQALYGAEFSIKPAGAAEVMSFVRENDGDVPVYRVATNEDTSGTTTVLTAGDKNSNKNKFIVYGLDANKKYKLEETKYPDGYQSQGAVDFTITATFDNTESASDRLKTLVIGGSDGQNGVQVDFSNDRQLNAKILNKAGGSKLAGTGGIGTSIFYVSGGILMAGALVLLVTKLRMRNKD